MDGLAGRLKAVKDRIARACDVCGRDPASVTLVAVSKTVGVEAVLAAYDLGVRDFGESRWQEAQTKVHVVPTDARWHFIGRLQSNKTQAVAGSFDVLHTLENDRQLEQLDHASRVVDGLVQVNLGREPQKSGVFSEDLDDMVRRVSKHRQVRFRGLMTIGPAEASPEETRRLFRDLAEMNHRLGGEWLSMGMSHDLESAVQEGSTHVRIGTALFGGRA
ncbi:MAG: YggS family pyridoxal phosphate-dependent enzyme [Fimbriimonadaceae bacterium]|nr:YggS family pyridoxal phosphate-dependent enzyme [Fimbriimonadaceae bacterium]